VGVASQRFIRRNGSFIVLTDVIQIRRRRMPSQIHQRAAFLNVDLEIASRRDLQPLVNILGQNVIVLYKGCDRRTHRAHLELFGTAKTADAAIRRFCDLLDRLPKPARALWNSAKERDFNIGVQAAMQPRSYEIALAQETVAAMAALKARIVFTLYAPGSEK
jgi:hypothetical protein